MSDTPITAERIAQIKSEFEALRQNIDRLSMLKDGPGAVSAHYTSLSVADVLGLVALFPQSGKMRESELLDVIRRARAAFDVEYIDGRPASVSYGSEALRPMIAALDAALAGPAPTHRRKSDGTEWVMERTASFESEKWLSEAELEGDHEGVYWVERTYANREIVAFLTPVSGGQAICVPSAEVSEKFEEMK